jgi:GYF domain 2
MSEGWYYAEGDNTVGPVALDELQSALRRRREASRVLVWTEGFRDWMEAGSGQGPSPGHRRYHQRLLLSLPYRINASHHFRLNTGKLSSL